MAKLAVNSSGVAASPSAGGTAAAATGVRRDTSTAQASSGTAAIRTHVSGSPAMSGRSLGKSSGALITAHSSRSAACLLLRNRRYTPFKLRGAASVNT